MGIYSEVKINPKFINDISDTCKLIFHVNNMLQITLLTEYSGLNELAVGPDPFPAPKT